MSESPVPSLAAVPAGEPSATVPGPGRAVEPPAARPALQRLESLLARGLAAARERFGAEADAFRGLYMTAEQAERLFVVPAEAAPAPAPEPAPDTAPIGPDWVGIAAAEPGWRWLRAEFGLTDTESDTVLLALAPEVDLRYERLFGFLQDDMTLRRPTVNLALDLLTGSLDQRLAVRAGFGPDGPLLRHRLLELLPDQRPGGGPLLARGLRVDPQIVDVLLEQAGLDRRLTHCCRLLRVGRTPGPESALPAERTQALHRLLAEAWEQYPVRLYFRGAPGSGRLRTSQALATALGVPLLVAELDVLLQTPDPDPETSVALLLREAGLQGALLHLTGTEHLHAPEHAVAARRLARRLAAHPGAVVLAGHRPWEPFAPQALGVHSVAFGARRPDPAATRSRLLAWRGALQAQGAAVGEADLLAVAERFRLGPEQVEDAVLTALTAARLRGPATAPELARADLFAAARAQGGPAPAASGRRTEPQRRWPDLVLPEEPLGQLRDVCDWVAQRPTVLAQWGFDRRFSRGTGPTALFTGPPGTGKTLAAEVIAGELGLDLFTVDLSSVVGTDLGETEETLERILTAAAETDAILFFDEVDALFGRRPGARDAHDRHGTVEIARLLRRLERYEGPAVLAGNLGRQLDEALTRRLQFVVEFPFPAEAERERIWRRSFPPGAPPAAEVDPAALARRFPLSGAGIRNVVLHAAYLAAAAGGPIGEAQLRRAAEREYRKLGKVLPAGAADREPR
ncbi:AAA family ATPase [Kitasatospora sp. NPDC058965]|uniref:AAA family ATPase n=1 Tax=Kitasatospora sp. NPDC058965 TaxID=3346682 RepID=UPI00367D016D